MRKFYLFLLCAAVMFTMAGCGDKAKDLDWSILPQDATEEPADDPTEPTEEEYVFNDAHILAKGWEDVSKTYNTGDVTLPEYIRVYKIDELAGAKQNVLLAVADLGHGAKWKVATDAEWDGEHERYSCAEKKLLADFYAASKAPVVMNAGYGATIDDGVYVPTDFIVVDGTIRGVQSAEETQGVFYQTDDGTCAATYVYSFDAGAKTYSYAEYIASDVTEEDGTKFVCKQAVGCTPLILKDGKLKNVGKNSESDAAPYARSVIGYNKTTKQLYIFCCGVKVGEEKFSGLTTEEVGNALLDIGGTDAVNLSGSGHTSMLINGATAIEPKGDERARIAAIIVY